MVFFECPSCGTKLPYAGKHHACKVGKSSGGGVESRHTRPTPRIGQIVERQGPSEMTSTGTGLSVSHNVQAGVAPSPPETKPRKRAPRGTFDRIAYQREYMRERRRKHKAQK